MRRFSILDWSLEQKWMVILLIFLIFYNNPLYPLIFLSNNFLPSILDGIFQTNFLCILLFFWLSIYHGIRQVYKKNLACNFYKVFICYRIFVDFHHFIFQNWFSLVFYGYSLLYFLPDELYKNIEIQCII